MIQNILFVSIGLACLVFGGNWLVKGAARLASSFNVSPLLIGLTVVAFGTSAPELMVSVRAALQGNADISLGNVIGSNVANIGLILGITGLFFPIVVETRFSRRELPLMIFVSLFVFALSQDGQLSQLDGFLMLVGMVGFTALSYYWAVKEKRRLQAELLEYEEEEGLIEHIPANRWRNALMLVVGIIILVIGADLLVRGATEMALEVGVSAFVIGITLVAVGTSLPELTTTLMAGGRGESDIAVGNVVGSNIVNLLVILGITALIQPMNVGDSLLRFEFPLMVGFAVLIWPFALSKNLGRGASAVFVISYIGFVVATIFR